MKSQASSPEEYINQLPDDRKAAFNELRKTILANLPKGFSESVSSGMIGYCVPHSIYPAGYHCNPKQPLPFISIASQKNAITLYHMGVYASPELLEWFTSEYPKHSKTKLDMGKSCIRFKKPDEIPFKLIGELSKKMTPNNWIQLYEKIIKRV